ncbi:MAG TPA: LysR substrate-binding domain-containing protein [Acidobacteriaceae bacterium]|jgi:DNA-binding transcriptional LysR family regulator
MYEWAEFRHFLYLLTILESGGLRSAAERLNTSQPNLSVQAKQFQEFGSFCLYRRAKSGRIEPTAAGLAFVGLARQVLEARDEAIEALVAIERGEVGSIRLGCSPLVDQELFRTLCAMHKELLPACPIWPTHADTMQLANEILVGEIDAALITQPLKHPELRVETLRHDSLVVCLRRDSPLVKGTAIQISDLQENLAILYHPQRHIDAHAKLLDLLQDAGVKIEKFATATHPSEMQMLVKEGYGLALIREGTPLDAELTTRRVVGVDWTVGTAVVFHREKHPKTIPPIIRKLRRRVRQASASSVDRPKAAPIRATNADASTNQSKPVQLPLLR